MKITLSTRKYISKVQIASQISKNRDDDKEIEGFILLLLLIAMFDIKQYAFKSIIFALSLPIRTIYFFIN